MGKKEKSHLKRIGFRKGGASPLKGQKIHFETAQSSAKYVRLSKESFESRIHKSNDGILTFRDVDGSETSAKALRPPDDMSKRSKLVDDYTQPVSAEVHPDLLTNKLYQPLALQNMFNTEIKKHMTSEPNCTGELQFDALNSKKWGLCWSERLKCNKCSFISEFYKLFDEVETEKRGRKAAKPNVGLQVGLKSTQISNTGARRILMHTNIIPPSRTSMQHQANKVGDVIVEANKRSMSNIRAKIKAENETCGQANSTLIRAESDSRYNNPIFNSENTPFQSATQVTTLLCENNTTKKQVIGVFTGNKLCSRCSRLGAHVGGSLCPNHEGFCSANLSETETIGNEQKWTESVVTEVNHDLKVSHLTTDGDSKSYKGLLKAQTDMPAENLKDLRHLSNSMKREINRAPFSRNMFDGENRSNLRNRFSLSVKARALAELKQAHKKYNGDIMKITAVMPKITDTIISCFKGSCGPQCSKHSLVCNGNSRQRKFYMPLRYTIRMTKSDEKFLRDCIEILLGKKNLHTTKFLTTTQKCEAVNKSLQVSNPKTNTYSRNFPARIHAQVLRQNLGPADSTVHACNVAGADISKGSRLLKHLLYDERQKMSRTHPGTLRKAKLKRHKARQRKYSLHESIHYKKGISDPKPDFKTK